MRFEGLVDHSSPDPVAEVRARALELGIAVAGLEPQPHLEDWGPCHVVEQHMAGHLAVTFSRSYTLRLPGADHKLDPAVAPPAAPGAPPPGTLEDAPEQLLAALPAWLRKQNDRAHYPGLWNAVETHWTPYPRLAKTLPELLREHILQAVLNWQPHYCPDGAPAPAIHEVSEAYPYPGVIVDGSAATGLAVDVGAVALGLGLPLDGGRIMTAVLPNRYLSDIELRFVSAASLTAGQDGH